jgi:hypothetical protein
MTVRLLPFYPGLIGVPGSESELGLLIEPQTAFGAGNFYYVNGYTGNDTNSGYSPDAPFLTITKAISMCTANNHDYVIVMRYPSAGAAGETWPLALSVETMHLIGCNQAGASPLAWLAPTGDTAAITLSAGGIEVAGFDVRGGATHGCIENSGTVWRAHIHHCEFGRIGAGQDGIRMTGAVDCPHWLIEDCIFGNNLTRSGIYITHNSTRTGIRRNLFHGCAGVAVNVVNTFALGQILDNQFRVADLATGEAVTLAATATDGAFISGNTTGQGVVAMGNVPYRDLGANHWGLNYYGLLAIMPVTV